MNPKELAELKEEISAREKLDGDYLREAGKSDARLAKLLTKLQAVPEAKPVGPITYSRDLPRKPRSDKGKPRKATEPTPENQTEAPGADSQETIDPAYMTE